MSTNISLFNPALAAAATVALVLPDGTKTSIVNGVVTVADDMLLAMLRQGYQVVQTTGATAARPANAPTGFRYFDTTLNKPIWRNAAGTGWVDATGTAA